MSVIADVYETCNRPGRTGAQTASEGVLGGGGLQQLRSSSSAFLAQPSKDVFFCYKTPRVSACAKGATDSSQSCEKPALRHCSACPGSESFRLGGDANQQPDALLSLYGLRGAEAPGRLGVASPLLDLSPCIVL